MEQDTKTYQEHIEKQLAQYGALIRSRAHDED